MKINITTCLKTVSPFSKRTKATNQLFSDLQLPNLFSSLEKKPVGRVAPDVSNPLENEKLKKTITTKDDFESVKLEAEDFEFRKVDFDQKFGK